jgi:hypothetical protein
MAGGAAISALKRCHSFQPSDISEKSSERTQPTAARAFRHELLASAGLPRTSCATLEHGQDGGRMLDKELNSTFDFRQAPVRTPWLSIFITASPVPGKPPAPRFFHCPKHRLGHASVATIPSASVDVAGYLRFYASPYNGLSQIARRMKSGIRRTSYFLSHLLRLIWQRDASVLPP